MSGYGTPDPLRHEPGAPVPVLHRRTLDVVASMATSAFAASVGIAGAVALAPHDSFYALIAAVAGVLGTVETARIGLVRTEQSAKRPAEPQATRSERDRIWSLLRNGMINAKEAERLLQLAVPDKSDVGAGDSHA